MTTEDEYAEAEEAQEMAVHRKLGLEIDHLKDLLGRCLTTIEDAGANALHCANLSQARKEISDGWTEVAATYATLAKEIRNAIAPAMSPQIPIEQ